MQAFYGFFLAVSLALCQQSNNPPFKIAISADSSTVVAESDVWIKVSLTNTSNQDLDDSGGYFTGIDLDPNFRFEVRDERGKLVPKRTYPHPELRTGYPVNRSISPGQTFTQEQRVSVLYDMREPGKYTIQVWRRNPEYDIKSNIVTVTVTATTIDRSDPDATLRAYFAAWNRNDTTAQKSFMVAQYADLGWYPEPVESVTVISAQLLDEKSALLWSTGAADTTRVYRVVFDYNPRGGGFSMEHGRYTWTYVLTRDAKRGSWLISNYGG
jgi:hypothetical protein